DAPTRPTAAVKPGEAPTTPSATGPRAALTALIRSIFPLDRQQVYTIVAALYALGYFVIGFLAALTWMWAGATTPDLVKNLALIAFGLLLAIGRSFFNPPK